ncbi:MAG: PIN domain-containing protein [Mucilaginibacter sp.]
MAYKRLFLDRDVLLDVLLQREPFSFYSQILVSECEDRKLSLNTSALAIANIHYILRKKVGATTAKNIVGKLIKEINILTFEHENIKQALLSPFNDFEDAMQYNIAERDNCEVIITRNIKDYQQATIPVLTAEQFLRTL